MLGSRRPREVYRVYSEDELLEGDAPGTSPGTQEHAAAAHLTDDEPVVTRDPKPMSRPDRGEWVGDWPRHEYGGGSWLRARRRRRLVTTVLAAGAGLAVGLGAVTLIERALTGRRATFAQPVAATGSGTVAASRPRTARPRPSRRHPARSRVTLARTTRAASVQRRRSASPPGTAPGIYAVAYDPSVLGLAPIAAESPQSEGPGFGADEADAEFGFER
jgi:hypothetical protein